MKRIVSLLAALLMTLLMMPAFALEVEPEHVDMIPLDPPLRMDAGWEWGDMDGEPDSPLPEGYMIADLWRQDLLYFAVLRDDGAGGQEILLLMDANHDDADNLNYIMGSWERSGLKSMYFMMINGETSHGLLYRYDVAANRFEEVLGGPCSNNMVLPDGMPPEYADLGYLLNGDSILALDLKTAEVKEAVSIADLGGLPEIGGSFFDSDLQNGIRKYTYLLAGGTGEILLNTVVVNYNDFSQLHKVTYAYDVALKQITGTLETDGEF